MLRFTAIMVFSIISTAVFADGPDREKLPMELAPFEGKIGKTYKESESDWQEPPAAPEGAPNVIVILLDDVGFGQSSTFGGLVPTPNLDKLASEGLKFNRFHTTAICGPSRAALLTGRNHHECGNGFLMEWATGFPSYSTMLPKNTATIGEILKDNGYNTWWYGKNHNTPDWETTVAGPFDRWPTGMGFEYFYGFIGGETHQFYPVLYENTTPIEQDKTPEEGYHFMTDMTDKAIARMKFAKTVAPNKPFFMYFAPGAMHAPHHVTQEWRDKFKGRFDMGWEKYREMVYQNQLERGIIPAGTKLTPRPDWVPEWDSLNDEQKELYCAFMENFAGYFAFTDQEIGRLLDAVKELPDADNTMVIYIVGDNGASSEGGPDGTLNEIKGFNSLTTSIEDILANIDKLGGPESEPHYPTGWAWAGNTPFQWVKQVASHLGGTRNPMVISWPARIKHDDKPRDAFLHLVDVVPTILEAADIPMPEEVNGIEQKPLAGKSFLASFTDPEFEGRDQQYFEVFSNRSIYHDGWKANAQHTFPWRQDYAPGNWEKDQWELYNLKEDFSESNDLAEQPPMKNKSWTLTANIKTEGEDTEGVVLAFGGVAAGLVLYLDDGVPVFDYNFFEKHTILKGDGPLPAGDSVVTVDFDFQGKEPGGPAAVALSVGGKKVAEAKMDETVGIRFGLDSFGIGEDSGQPVTFDYKPPFKFTGEIEKVVIELK
jgi:arylsulfatase A-like enzyme